jgi:hypothetical protein
MKYTLLLFLSIAIYLAANGQLNKKTWLLGGLAACILTARTLTAPKWILPLITQTLILQ